MSGSDRNINNETATEIYDSKNRVLCWFYVYKTEVEKEVESAKWIATCIKPHQSSQSDDAVLCTRLEQPTQSSRVRSRYQEHVGHGLPNNST